MLGRFRGRNPDTLAAGGVTGISNMTGGFLAAILRNPSEILCDFLRVFIAGESTTLMLLKDCWIFPKRSSSSVNSVAGLNWVSAG